MFSNNELEILRELDSANIKENVLKELTEIVIDFNMDIKDRTEHFFNEIHNPYYFLVEGTPVQITYNNYNDKTLDDCLSHYLLEQKNNEK